MDLSRAWHIFTTPITPYLDTDDGGEEFEAFILSTLLDMYQRGEIDKEKLQLTVNKFDEWKQGKEQARDAIRRWNGR